MVLLSRRTWTIIKKEILHIRKWWKNLTFSFRRFVRMDDNEWHYYYEWNFARKLVHDFCLSVGGWNPSSQRRCSAISRIFDWDFYSVIIRSQLSGSTALPQAITTANTIFHGSTCDEHIFACSFSLWLNSVLLNFHFLDICRLPLSLSLILIPLST